MKLLMTFHRTLGFESARYRDKIRNSFCGLMSEAVVTASEERRRHYLSENAIAASKLHVVPLGVDLERFQPDSTSRSQVRSALGIGEQTVVVGTIGHFGPEKGVDLAIEAFNQCASQHPMLDLALVVLGDGTAEQWDRIRRVSQVNHSKLVYLAGFQSDVWRWMSAFDILLHTPRMEAFGLVVIEAMACRLPVVATRVGSMPEIVREGETGLLVEPESIDTMAQALKHLVLNRDYRHSLHRGHTWFAQRVFLRSAPNAMLNCIRGSAMGILIR